MTTGPKPASQAYKVDDLFDQQDESDGFMKRLWAYLTIKQLQEQAEAEEITLSEYDTTDDESGSVLLYSSWPSLLFELI